MKMMMLLLLVSAVALSATTAYPSTHDPHSSLKHIFDLVEQHNGSFSTEGFVEGVTHLIDEGCKITFFCKVHDLLHNNTHFKESEEKAIVGNLQHHTQHTSCEELLKKVKPANHQITISKLVEHLIFCIRQEFFRAGKDINAKIPATQ